MVPTQSRSATVAELARLVGGTLRGGRADAVIRGVSSLERAGPEDVTWVSEKKHAPRLAGCRAGAVLVEPGTPDLPIPAIHTGDPQAAMLKVLAYFDFERARPPPGVHPTAVVETGVALGEGVAVGPYVQICRGARIGAGTRLYLGAYVGADAEIGRDCELWPHAFVADRCRLGDRVILKPGAAIGTDGFGFIFRDGRHCRLPQIGSVHVEDDVEIGAHCCVDRAKFGVTRVGRGAKIDNLVQVAHNCEVGALCILTGQVGLAGSVRLGPGVVMGGKAGVVDGVSVVGGARIGAAAVVTKDIERPAEYSGIPARPHVETMRNLAAARQVPKLAAQVAELQERVAQLEAAMHDREAG